MQEMKKSWDTHKKVVITGAQIITILTLVAGILSNHFSVSDNQTAIASQNQWMKDAIKEQRQKIEELEIKNAKLETEIGNFKEFYLYHHHSQEYFQ